MGKILKGEELRKRAAQLGVSETASYGVIEGSNEWMFDEPEVQRRVMEAERHLRDAKLWMIAVISALASLASAIAAWVAVLIAR